MFGPKEFTGLVLEGDAIKMARVKVEANKLRLLKLDQFSLVEPIKEKSPTQGESVQETGSFEEEMDADSIFGFEDEEEDDNEDELADLDLDNLDDEEESEEDVMSLDMVEEADAGGAQSNEILLYNILNGIDNQNVNVGLNVPAGNTIFQIIRDTNFKDVKKKDLIEDLENKLQSIYGQAKSSDNYSYEVRDDGSLVLASVEEESALLKLVNRADDLYSGKLTVREVLPDEAALVGLVRANYNLQPDEITGIIQFSPKKCRVVFMTGNEIWQVSPIINEGTNSKSFLNTLFSKILFQLDTGEVPNLDRIILANNTIGDDAIDFLQNNFSDVIVTNFRFNEEKFDYEDVDESLANSFTTAISLAWAASEFEKKSFPNLSLLPSYVVERQKIFKLQWHGVILLALIFLAPITFNYFYQQKARQIENLSSELETINAQIAQIEPTVQATNEISNDLAQLREKLVLLDTLSNGSREWQAKLDILNEGMRPIENTWITSMTQAQSGTFVEGYSLYRNRIPRVVNIFADATLLNVTIEDIREQEVFRFSILVNEFAVDDSVYSLPKTDELKEILTGGNQ
ncbi:hypothetical protein G3570_07000 [Balneolaceae bacterium YR4-1]|uniref:Fimbrial assembly protein (PilN) n=1 Tax=Halalkalibaculum roseum TaxID=2709311 RepID=A0A6M1SU67_9BACT|nr:hypothetical protein [Halalkalibaculum roseum]NGP76372.1 hypothetical protein [Halalkalibaculum roseum]